LHALLCFQVTRDELEDETMLGAAVPRLALCVGEGDPTFAPTADRRVPACKAADAVRHFLPLPLVRAADDEELEALLVGLRGACAGRGALADAPGEREAEALLRRADAAARAEAERGASAEHAAARGALDEAGWLSQDGAPGSALRAEVCLGGFRFAGDEDLEADAEEEEDESALRSRQAARAAEAIGLAARGSGPLPPPPPPPPPARLFPSAFRDVGPPTRLFPSAFRDVGPLAPGAPAPRAPPLDPGVELFAPPRVRLEDLRAVDRVVREGYDGFAMDSWSLGAILYVLLAGRNVFREPEPPASLGGGGGGAAEAGEAGEAGEAADAGADAPAPRQPSELQQLLMGAVDCEGLAPDARDLVLRLCQVSPEHRLSVFEALRHPFVTGVPREAAGAAAAGAAARR